jgi:predicted ATP-binding protein involved in virulence
MKLSRITIENFRAVKKLELPLDPQLTVLVGDNAAGKTTILDAIAVGLGAVLTRLPEISGIDFRSNDLRQELATLDGSFKLDYSLLDAMNKAPYTRITLESVDGVSWDRTKKRDQTKRTKEEIPPDKKLSQLHDFLDKIINDVQDGKASDLPIIAYYDTGRAPRSWVSVSQQRHLKKSFNRFKALENALNNNLRSEAMAMIDWFALQEDLERRAKERLPSYRSTELETIRQALRQILPGCSHLHTMMDAVNLSISLLITFKKEGGGEILSLDQLSDGYRMMLALVMNLARRMLQANPHREKNALESEAIVLIDEVDLHLHPKWQQRLLIDLMAIFPNTQFIVTTHSPQVLTTIKPEHIILLEHEKEVIAEQVTSSYGAESGRLLSEIMDVDERPPANINEFTRLLEQYYHLIERNQGESEDALKIRSRLNELSIDDPDLITANMEIERRRETPK